MRLAPRLLLSFGLLAFAMTSGVGFAVRETLRARETRRFDADVKRACTLVDAEVQRQAEADRKILTGACQAGELVDRVLVALEVGDLGERRLGFASLVPREREAFDLDELLLVSRDEGIIGADPKALWSLTTRDIEREISASGAHFILRAAPATSAIVNRCVKSGRRGKMVGLIGARRLDTLLARIEKALDVAIFLERNETPRPSFVRAPCIISDVAGNSLPIAVEKSIRPLEESLAQVDEAVLVTSAAALVAALLLALLVARSLGKPLSVLAAEAGKVADGQATPLRVRGSGEVRELTLAFNKMIDDLSATRQRLAAASRIAAWREVARRVAHEVKNPLAPIRAAVETLRRLRARDDPAFLEYFDEATRTVLDEVFRISNIVTEFTRFARLPAPRPTLVDLVELVRDVATLQMSDGADVELQVSEQPPPIMADRDQIVQVVTNLVQNAKEANGQTNRSLIRIVIGWNKKDTVSILVSDEGSGVPESMRPHLFEPYATTKPSGTGLGLAIAQRIAIEHLGELIYEGKGPGQRGAAFRLSLPISGPPVDVASDRGR